MSVTWRSLHGYDGALHNHSCLQKMWLGRRIQFSNKSRGHLTYCTPKRRPNEGISSCFAILARFTCSSTGNVEMCLHLDAEFCTIKMFYYFRRVARILYMGKPWNFPLPNLLIPNQITFFITQCMKEDHLFSEFVFVSPTYILLPKSFVDQARQLI